MALKAGRVGVAPSEVDQQGKVTAGGMTPEQSAKLDRALVSPVTAPTEKEVVGVGTANDQIMFKIGSGLELEGETSPYTLKASGGGSISIDNTPEEETGVAEYHRIEKDDLDSFEFHIGNSVWVRLRGKTKSWSKGSTVFKIDKYANYNIARLVPAEYFSASSTVNSSGQLFTKSSGTLPSDGTDITIDLYKNN